MSAIVVSQHWRRCRVRRLADHVVVPGRLERLPVCVRSFERSDVVDYLRRTTEAWLETPVDLVYTVSTPHTLQLRHSVYSVRRTRTAAMFPLVLLTRMPIRSRLATSPADQKQWSSDVFLITRLFNTSVAWFEKKCSLRYTCNLFHVVV